MAREADAALQAKILRIGFVIVFLCAVLYGVRGMMFGSKSVAGIVAGFSLILAFALMLDKDYWVLFPLLSASGLRIPTLPFSSTELGCLTLVSVFCIRTVLRRDRYHFRTAKYVLWAVPYFIWCLFVFCLNPVGLHMFGSTMIGGRHYFHLVLGFAVLCVLSQIEFSEKGLRLLFWGLIVCAFIQTGLGYFGFLEASESVEVVRTRYYLQSFGTIISLILCRRDLSRIVLSPLFFVCLFCSGLVLLSGRRVAVGSLLLMPFVLMFLRRRGYLFTLFCALLGALALAVLVAGHGRFYELPYSVQRGLSFVPGKWDRSFERMGFNDDFRAELHRRAKLIIHEHPWVGRKGLAMDAREISWIVLYTGSSDKMWAGHELAGNWHNKFYGMWADFGVIAPFAWYGFLLAAIVWCFRKRNRFLDSSYASTFYRYWFYLLFLDLILAYGHSTNTPFDLWPVFGSLLALINMREPFDTEQSTPVAWSETAPISPPLMVAREFPQPSVRNGHLPNDLSFRNNP